jgi:hypothetical protein
LPRCREDLTLTIMTVVATSYWTGPDITAWVAALGGLAGFVALGLTVQRQRRQRTLPPAELDASLLWLLEVFGDMIAGPHRDTSYFLTPERQHQQTLLATLNGRIMDDDLNSLVGDARAEYHECWVHSGMDMHVTGDRTTSPDDRDGDRDQREHARTGQSKVVAAVERMNALIRKAA